MPLDDILDARFDEDGRLSQIGRGHRQRTAERLDPRPPAISAEELERAVKKLARGLESIERQGSLPRPQEPRRAAPTAPDAPSGRDFVTYSLDRLEARLEALSKRLEQRAGGASTGDTEASRQSPALAPDQSNTPTMPVRDSAADAAPDLPVDPSFAVEPRRSAEADLAEMERRRSEAAEAELRAASLDAGRRAIAAEAERRAQAAEVERQAHAAEAERRAQAAEAGRRAEAAEAERRAELARQAEATFAMRGQLSALAERVEALQQNGNEAEIEALRQDLHELLHHIGDVGRDNRSIAAAVQQMRARLDAMEPKVNAARNMAGNRLGELQDRLSGLTERLGDMEAEIPGFDAVRENQTAILERFDRIEGIVHRLASPEDLSERVAGLRNELQNVASQSDVARIGEQILSLAERLESLPGEVSDSRVLERIEAQLQALGAEFTDTRRRQDSGAADLDRHLSELSTALKGIGDAGRGADLSGLDMRLSDIGARLDQDRRSSGETLARLDKRLAALAAAVEKQEDDAAATILTGITGKMDALAGAIEAQDAPGARRDVEALDRKLDQLSHSLTDQAEHLSRRQMEPLEERLDRMQTQLEEIARAQASADHFGPFAQKLQDIAERVSSLDLGSDVDTSPITARLAAIEDRLVGLSGKATDSRTFHNQLESILSRLELLKGRSIDPARLNELLDRIDGATQGGLSDDRFDRLERKLDGIGGLPEERFARLEEILGAGAQTGLADERFARLERKLDDFGAAIGVGPEVLTQQDLGELRNDIVALRRELRSLPGLGDGESSLAAVLKTISARLERLPDEPPATLAELEAQIDRVAQLLEDPTHSRLALAHIEASLGAITERLGETRRTGLYRPAGADGQDGETALDGVADFARSLSEDVTVLKSASQASERKTKDALEAVQGTLEAVVKRMAFLERDADLAATSGQQFPAEATARPVVPGATAQLPGAGPEQAEPQIPAAAAEPAREAGSASLFSRFTSSQLLRRATGGRTDSFSPDVDDGDDTDLPLEPGTDAPLNSALSGAPSSDTALMSGDRGRGRATRDGRSADLEPSRARRTPSDLNVGDDFLAAARRAAQAAAAEVAEAEREAQESRESSGLGRILGLMKGRRRAILASALAVAVAFAAFQIIRGIIDADQIEIAARPAVAAADRAPLPAAASPSDSARTAAAPAAAPAVRSVTPAPASAAATASRQQAPEMPPAPTDTASMPAPVMTASLQPSSSRPTAEPAATAPPELSTAPQASLSPIAATLPVPIGPDRLRDAAMAGDPAAAFEVAARYAEGRGVGQDLGAAIAWYEHAGGAGLAPAQYRLGSIYEKGFGVAKDAAKAQEWYRRAADAGNVKAMHNLAVLHAEGAGGEPDLERAAALFRQAAEHGVRDSQFNLAILHARGLGVPQDMLQAYKWFAVAASSGDLESIKRRDIVAASLSKGDLAKGQAAAEAFEPLPLNPEANDVAMPEGGWGQETTSVQVQSENDLVALVQELLTEKGLDPGPADGLLGEQTIQAIGEFQKQAGLPTTGQIDADLVAALKGQSS